MTFSPLCQPAVIHVYLSISLWHWAFLNRNIIIIYLIYWKAQSYKTTSWTQAFFSISSLVKIWLHWYHVWPCKLYLNLLVYDRNTFRSSMKVFGNLQKMFWNICVAFRQFLETLKNSSEFGWKSQLEKLSKRLLSIWPEAYVIRFWYDCIINKIIHGCL